MNEYLKETKYCNYKNSIVINKALALTINCTSDKEKAIVLFYYVRDNILYKLDLWNVKASETLVKGYGMCTNKSNLLIALLRACAIPAGYGILKVNAQEYFGPIMPPMFKESVSTSSVHTYCYVNYSDRWIKCDSSTDIHLSKKTSYFNYTTELVNWDGENNALDNIDPKHIMDDLGPFPNIDDRLDKKPKNATKIFLNLASSYILFLRETEEKFTTDKEFENKFILWLKKKPMLRVLLYTFKFGNYIKFYKDKIC